MTFIKKCVNFIFGTTNLDKARRNGMKVGSNLFLGRGTFLDPSHCFLISIGDNVTLSSKVHVLCHDASSKAHIGYTKVGGVSIGNNVFIGANATILPCVKIGDNAVVGAGSVVTHSVPSGEVWAGNPAHFICKVDDYLKKMDSLEKFDSSYHIGVITEEKKKELIEKTRNGFCLIE